MKSFLTVLIFLGITLPDGLTTASYASSPGKTSSGTSTLAEFSIPFAISLNNLSSYERDFGVHPSATNGIDASLGEVEYPPFPPGGGFTMFLTSGGHSVLDLRASTSSSQIDTFKIGAQFDETDSSLFPIQFSWPDLNVFYSGSVRMKCDAPAFDINMKSQTSYVLSNPPPLAPFGYFLVVTIVAEGPISGTTLPVVSTSGFGLGGLQSIVHAPPAGPSGSINPSGIATGTMTWFEYGATRSYGTSTTPQSVSDGVSALVTEPFNPGTLPMDSRIHFRAVAQNGVGTFYGADLVLSNGHPPAEIAEDTTMYRTATYRDWADAKDQKDKRKSVKGKPDKVDFVINIGAPTAATGFNLKFGMETSGKAYIGKAGTDTIPPSAPWNHTKFVTFSSPVAFGDTFQLEGVGYKGKKIDVSVTWATSPRPVLVKYVKDNPAWKTNVPKLPMPNLHNVGEDIYGGTSQTPVNITVGTTADPKGAHTVQHSKYKDVLKSLVKESKGTALYHTAEPGCLGQFDKNHHDIKTLQKSLPPDKQNNRLFAEQLTLKLNVAASDSEIFPPGLGDLIFDYSPVRGSPGTLDGKSIREVVDSVDKYLGCNGQVAGTSDPAEFVAVDSLINVAFAGPFDTTSWSSAKVICTGVRMINDVPYLHASPAATPVIRHAYIPAVRNFVPSEYRLSQNYPNPFNPSTTIEFELAGDALVTVKVYNTLGQEVASLANRDVYTEGENELEFDGSNLSSGVYFYRIIAEDIETGVSAFVAVKKMILVK